MFILAVLIECHESEGTCEHVLNIPGMRDTKKREEKKLAAPLSYLPYC